MKVFTLISLGLMGTATTLGVVDYVKAINSNLLSKVYNEKPEPGQPNINNPDYGDVALEDYSRKKIDSKAEAKVDKSKKKEIAKSAPPALPAPPPPATTKKINFDDVGLKSFSRARMIRATEPKTSINEVKPALVDTANAASKEIPESTITNAIIKDSTDLTPKNQ